MRTILLTIALSITALISNAQSADDASSEGVTIQVIVPVPSTDGSVIFALYNEDTFMKAAPLQSLESEIIDGKATVTFVNVKPGTYAVTLLHDKNGNKIMDFEANGMPKEMYGVSNNVMNFGPPQWKDAKFEVATEAIQLDIRM